MQTNSRRSFIFSLVAFALILISIIAIIINKKQPILPVFIGLPFILAGLSGTFGFVFSIKSIKEKNTAPKIISLIFNGFIVLSLVAFLLGDILKH